MVNIRIDGAMTLEGRAVDLAIEDGSIVSISPPGSSRTEAEYVIDASGDLLMPGFCNSHTHAPMSILRGVGEDMELNEWLQTRIWPMEARMKKEHLKAGMELACLEMIRTGTTLFNDMYFREGDLAEVVSGTGIRAFLGEGFLDLFDEVKREESKAATLKTLRKIEEIGDPMVKGTLAPHAVYTVSEEGLSWCSEEAERRRIPFHIHLSETENEVTDLKRNKGCSPVEYLEGMGILGENTIAAHSVHLSDLDIELISKRGCTVSHLPVSNMKLCVGGSLRMDQLLKSGTRITIGTDGAASNNSLDMFGSMKFAALLAKHRFGASSIRARDVLKMATRSGYEAFGLHGGELTEGALADMILLDRKHHSLIPRNDMISNVVYSASGDCVKHSIIGGEIVMKDRKVKGEDVILQRAESSAETLREMV
ncbi:MAG: amidohydrolase [Thermoplasmatota archaeon]